MNICVLDDDKEVLDDLELLIRNVFTNCENLYLYDNVNDISKVLNNIDVLFMDIKLKNSNGITFIKNNKIYLDNTKIIYITGYDYVEDIFETNPFYYLKKPITIEKLKKVYSKIIKEDNYLAIKNNKEIIRVSIKDIMYIESMARVILFHLKNDEIIRTYTTIDSVKKNLPSYFIQIHKSFIINMKNIKSYKKNEIKLTDETKLNISRNYADIVQESIMNFIRCRD